MNVHPSELGRFHPVAENLVLAATARAQRHSRWRAGDPVSLIDIAAHLGFERGAYTTRKMRPILSQLVEAGAMERSRRLSREHWALTRAGRARLTRARRGEQLQLPESPQHRLWRETHTQAVEGMDAYRGCLREALHQAAALIEDEAGDSLAWQKLTKRLAVRSELLGSAIHCAREWAEPADSTRDVQDARPLEERRRILWHPDKDA